MQGCFVVTCTLCAFISLVWLREQIVHGGAPIWLEHAAPAFNAAGHHQNEVSPSLDVTLTWAAHGSPFYLLHSKPLTFLCLTMCSFIGEDSGNEKHFCDCLLMFLLDWEQC